MAQKKGEKPISTFPTAVGPVSLPCWKWGVECLTEWLVQAAAHAVIFNPEAENTPHHEGLNQQLQQYPLYGTKHSTTGHNESEPCQQMPQQIIATMIPPMIERTNSSPIPVSTLPK